MMLDREIINKMNEDELRNYLYHLQRYTKTVRKINSERKASKDTMICLLSQCEDLSVLTLKENKQINQLERLAKEMEDKYLSTFSSNVWEGDDAF